MRTEMTRAIIIHSSDNVATALDEIPAGTEVGLKKSGSVYRITVQEEISRGHKFSLHGIRKGETIIKYGEPIGVATTDIEKGFHVHTHNVESQRGRGDLTAREEI
jgi:altronate dehydratase small subunit